MGKKKLDVSAFIGSESKAEESEGNTIKTASELTQSKVNEEKEEVMITSFRLRKNFIKQMRIYAIQKDISTVSLIEQAVEEYIQKYE